MIMRAIGGMEWDTTTASQGTLRVHAIRRAQTCVYMGVSAAVEARNQCWYGVWALRGSTTRKLASLSPDSQDTTQSSAHHLKSELGSFFSATRVV